MRLSDNLSEYELMHLLTVHVLHARKDITCTLGILIYRPTRSRFVKGWTSEEQLLMTKILVIHCFFGLSFSDRGSHFLPFRDHTTGL